MPNLLTQEEANKLVLSKCNEKNCKLLTSFIYLSARKTKLHLKCNVDGYEWYMSYVSFIYSKAGCPKCGKLSTKYKNMISQEDAEKNVAGKCAEKNYTLLSPFIYIGNDKTDIKLRCNNDNHEWTTKYAYITNQNHSCPVCTNEIKPTQDEALTKILNKCKEKNYSLTEPFIYNNAKSKIQLKCNKDGYEWSSYYEVFINRDNGCRKCAGSATLTLNEFIEKARIIHGCKYDYSLVEYINNSTKVCIICNKHGKFWQTPCSHLSGQGCPICNESKGEKMIRLFLDSKGLTYCRQHKFNDCKHKYMLPFDFYIESANTCIEYDGIQHFKPISIFGGNKALEKAQKLDAIKNEYCLNNNITLIRIPYTDFNNIEKILTNKLLM